jgi:hypothetical protein
MRPEVALAKHQVGDPTITIDHESVNVPNDVNTIVSISSRY